MLPPAFVERWQELLGSELEPFLAALAGPRTNGLRVNHLKLAPERVESLLGTPLEPVAWCPTGFHVGHEGRAGSHPLHAVGAYYMQEPSAMAVAEALCPRPAERVLDLAAAPGGKATHLMSLMGGRGLLVANDVVPSRARVLAQNLERLGLPGVVTTEDPARLAAAWPGFFDRVLLDAPCSGEGMFRKERDAAREWSPGAVVACARRQSGLLDLAVELLRPGGTLAYSTCTFSPDENEMAVAGLLARRPDLDLIDLPGFTPGRPEWGGGDPRLARTARLWPHRLRGEGHFVALFRKGDGVEGRVRPFEAASLDAATRRSYGAFSEGFRPPDGELTVLRGELQLVADGTPSLHGIRLVRAGPAVAELRPGRLEPAHALSHLVGWTGVPPALDLAPDDPRLAAYLRGEALQSEGEAGWTLVRAFGLGLGWGKRVGRTLKNHYPKALRDLRRAAAWP